MTRPRIVVVNSASFGLPPNEDLLAQLQEFAEVARIEKIPNNIDSVSLEQSLRGAGGLSVDGIIASVTPKYTPDIIARLPELRFIARHGRGYDNTPLEAAMLAGVPVFNVDGLLEQASVAELAVGMALDVSRGITAACNNVTCSNWKDREQYHGPEIRGRTVGVIGVGIIGSAVVRICRFGFNARVLAVDPGISDSDIAAMGAEPVALAKLLSDSDWVMVCASDDPRWPLRLGRSSLSLLKQGVYLVNTARGVLWDEAVIVELLNAGRIAGVGVDVYPSEPPVESPLFAHPKVLHTPHLGGYGDDSKRGMGETVVRVCRAMISGDSIPWERCVNGVTEQTQR